MRVLIWLAAAILSAIAAGQARAESIVDPLCSTRTRSLAERAAICTRFIDKTPLVYKTGPWVADAHEVRAQARSDLGNCADAMTDVTTALRYTSPTIYKEPSVKERQYRYHVLGAFVNRNCAADYDAALAMLDRASKLMPAEPLAIAGRALMFSDKGDVRSANAELARAQALVHSNLTRSQVAVVRGVLLQREGRLAEAMPQFDEAIRLNPGYAPNYAERGNLWRLRGDLANALLDLNIGVRLSEDDPDMLAKRGEILRYRGDFTAAIADYNRTLAANPTQIRALAGRGLIYERLGERAKARQDFEAAVASPTGNTPRVLEVRDMARARLAALDAGQAAPVIAAAPVQAKSPTSVPTPVLAAPILTAPVVAQSQQTVPLKQGRRVALVIGNSAYRAVPELINPRNDANAIAASLRNVGFDVVMQAADTTREKLIGVLQAFANEAASADWAMVYYAGHGIEVNGQNYLIPVEARLAADRDVRAEAVALDHVMAALHGAKKLRLVVLDACRDNPFMPQMQRTTFVADATALSPTVGSTASTRSVGRGLGEVRVQGATLVVFAAKHGQTALDGEGGNSPFAIAMVQRIATPGVEINKIFRLVRDDVMEATAGRQEPYTYGSLPGREDFFFVAAK